jgi:hypothetical protein
MTVRQHRPIRRHEVKKLSIIRNPGTGPLIERLREKPMEGPIGFQPARPVADREGDWTDGVGLIRLVGQVR